MNGLETKQEQEKRKQSERKQKKINIPDRKTKKKDN